MGPLDPTSVRFYSCLPIPPMICPYLPSNNCNISCSLGLTSSCSSSFPIFGYFRLNIPPKNPSSPDIPSICRHQAYGVQPQFRQAGRIRDANEATGTSSAIAADVYGAGSRREVPQEQRLGPDQHLGKFLRFSVGNSHGMKHERG